MLSVPYLSQYTALLDEDRRSRACSIVCLAMVLSFLAREPSLDLNALFSEGCAIGARDATSNWTHTGIVRLARNHGVSAYAQEFRSRPFGNPSIYDDAMASAGLAKLRAEIQQGRPVIVSFVGHAGGPHTVVLVGNEWEKEEEVFVLHDPESPEGGSGAGLRVPVDEFAKKWRHMAIFFEPLP